jgi:hypothetical protein
MERNCCARMPKDEVTSQYTCALVPQAAGLWRDAQTRRLAAARRASTLNFNSPPLRLGIDSPSNTRRQRDPAGPYGAETVIPPAGPFNHGIEMRANCCVDEAFRDVDRAPTVMISVFEVMRDWLCSVQTS